jgi:hypothetical protein
MKDMQPGLTTPGNMKQEKRTFSALTDIVFGLHLVGSRLL